MGKQTKKSGSEFGGLWTKQKLKIIESYIKEYSIALKNLKVKKIYVDAFAGSGITNINKIVNNNENNLSLMDFLESSYDKSYDQRDSILEGSALLSLQYDFDEYYFVEIDSERIKNLEMIIDDKYPDKKKKIKFLNGDANQFMNLVVSRITPYHRCLMFLDPYSMELEWKTLELISKNRYIDLWYLFPLSVNRLIPKNKSSMVDSCREIVNKVFGTNEWENKLYNVSYQNTIFGCETIYERVPFNEIIDYIINKFKTIFPYVSDDSKILKNDKKKSPMFLLAFMMTNDSDKAVRLASKLVKAAIRSAEKID